MSRAPALFLMCLAFAGAFQLGRAMPAEPAATAGWATVGTLDRPRAFARAVPLSTGEILVVGGLDPADPEVTSYYSELIEPLTGRVTRLQQPLLGRLNQSVTIGWGERVYIVGGTEWRRTHWAPIDRLEVYIPDSKAWLIGAPLRTPRSDHGATALRDGRILVTGGNLHTTLLRSTEIYDPQTDHWTIAAQMPRARTQFSMATLPDGRVFVAGGFREDGAITASTLYYDPVADSWSEGPDLLEPRLNHSMVVLPGGDLLFIGGEASGSLGAERYEWRSHRFVDAGRIAAPRLVASAALLPDGRVLLTGGLPIPIRDGFKPVWTFEIWDGRTGWHPVGHALSARAFALLISTAHGVYRVSGSGDQEAPFSTIERFTQ